MHSIAFNGEKKEINQEAVRKLEIKKLRRNTQLII